MRLCSIDGCELIHKSRGWCYIHYGRWQRTGDPLKLIRFYMKNCSVEGCDGKHSAHGYCVKHDLRFKKYGDPLKNKQIILNCIHNNCLEPVHGQGYCNKHYRRYLKYGYVNETSFDLTPLERLLKNSKKNKINDCIEWKGSKNKEGYGSIMINHKLTKTHRLSYQLQIGEIPSGLLICHSCDNPSCINIQHLWVGTDKQNTADKYLKGRQNILKGEKNPSSKLKDIQVYEIRELLKKGEKGTEIAKKYSVHSSTIYSIKYKLRG